MHHEICYKIYREMKSFPLSNKAKVSLFKHIKLPDVGAVVPDISLYCDPKMWAKPDIVVDIWQSHDSTMERIQKTRAYEWAEIREIWGVYPAEQFVAVSTLTQRSFIGHFILYTTKFYMFGEATESQVIPNLSIVISGE